MCVHVATDIFKATMLLSSRPQRTPGRGCLPAIINCANFLILPVNLSFSFYGLHSLNAGGISGSFIHDAKLEIMICFSVS
jgi:hypothetical protein